MAPVTGWTNWVALFAIYVGLLAGCGKESVDAHPTDEATATEATDKAATERAAADKAAVVAPEAVLAAIVGLQFGMEKALPADIDISQYAPRFERGQWFLHGTQSFTMKAGGDVAPVGYLLQAKDVGRVGADGSQIIMHLARNPADTSKIVVFETEEYRRGAASYARTAQPKGLSSTETVRLNPPELLVAAKKTKYETQGISGKRTVVVRPVGLATLTVAGKEYQDALHMETTWQEHDAERTTVVIHSWWVPKLGMVAQVFGPGGPKPCGDDGCFFMATTLLVTGHSRGDEAALIRSINALLPPKRSDFEADMEATKRRLLGLAERSEVTADEAAAGVTVQRPAWADGVNNLRWFLWSMAFACEKSKKETVKLLQQGTLLGYEMAGENKVWSVDTYAPGLDEEAAQRFWSVHAHDRDPGTLTWAPPVNDLAADVIAVKRITFDGVLLRTKSIMDDEGIPRRCRDALLAAASAMLDGCGDGAPSSLWPVRWAAAAECELDKQTPGTSLCGHTSRASDSARRLPLWGDYVCRAQEAVPDQWDECLGRKGYADEAGRGCSGKKRCCPPAGIQIPATGARVTSEAIGDQADVAEPRTQPPVKAGALLGGRNTVTPPAAPSASCEDGNGAACFSRAVSTKDPKRSFGFYVQACKYEYGRGCAVLAMITSSQGFYKKAARFSRRNCGNGVGDECGSLAIVIDQGKASGEKGEALGLAQKGCRLGSDFACKQVKTLGGTAR